MNKLLKNNLINHTLVAVVLVVLFVPQLAFAQTSFLQETLWSVVNSVFGFFAWMGGWTLNYAVTNYVVGFGHNFLESGTGNSVDILWTLVRDIFNLTFIFGLVYIGLKMILDSSDSQARTMLVHLILAALLVNFSLFITKFVVDLSNVTAAQIAGAFPISNGVHGVSSSFMNILGFNDLFSPGASLKKIAGSSAGYTYIFSTMFLYIILAFVFLSGGIMLIIRYIVLIMYMILSPVMFLGWVFPGFASVSRDYWRKFLGRAFFAPAYLLMLYFANQVLVSMQGANGINTGSYGAVFSGRVSEVGNNMGAVIPFFFMTAGFLIAALVVGQKMGAEGANSAIAIGRRASGKARQYATNAATYIPRAGSRIAVNKAGESATRRLNSIQAGDGKLARFARTNLVDRSARGAATSAAGAQFGTGTTNKANRDYRGKTESRATNNRNISRASELETLKALTNPSQEQKDRLKELQDNGGESRLLASVAGMGTSDIEEMGEAERNSIGHLFTSSQVENFNKSDKASDTEKGSLGAARKTAIENTITDQAGFISDELNKLSISQIETLGEEWISKNAHFLSDSQMEDVKKSKKYTEAQKGSFGDSRKTNFNNMAASPDPASFSAALGGKKPKDLAKLPRNILMNSKTIPYISAAVLREIATNGTLSPTDQKTLETEIMAAGAFAESSARGYFGSVHAQNNWG